MIHLARCCSPVPGDSIMGFITQGRGVSVHRDDCSNAVALAQRLGERIIDVEWDGSLERPVPRGARGPGLRPLAAAARRLQGGRRVPPQHHLESSSTTSGSRIVRMVFDVELADPTHLVEPAGGAQGRRRRLRRLPPAARAEQDLMSDAVAPFQAPIGHPRRPRAGVGAVGGRSSRPSRSSPTATASRWSSRRCSRTSASSTAASASTATSPRKEMYVFTDRGERTYALRPEGTAPVVRAFVQHQPDDAVEGVVRRRRPFATSGPRPGATASTTSSASRCSAPTTPPSTSRSSPWPQRFYEALGLTRVRLLINSMGHDECRAALRRAAARPPRRARRPSCATSTSTTLAQEPAARPRLQARGVRRGDRATGPMLLDFLCDDCRDALRPRCATGSTSLGIELDARPPARARLRLLHAHDLRVRRRRAGLAPRTPSAGAAATTGSPSSSAASRRRGIGFGSRASSDCCSPARPRASDRA